MNPLTKSLLSLDREMVINLDQDQDSGMSIMGLNTLNLETVLN